MYTVYRRNCCSRNRRVCIYNYMYNESLCKDIHCTCCCKYKPYDYDYNSSSYRRCTKTFIVHVLVNTNPTRRNRRVCIYNNMYNECLCTPSRGGTVVVVIVGFVFTTTCTMNVSSSYRRCTKTLIVHVVVNTNPTITTTTVPPIDGVQRH
jgi:hypothetical protein